MKITASRLDEARIKLDDINKQRNQQKENEDRQSHAYRMAVNDKAAQLEKEIMNQIGSTTTDVSVRVRQDYNWNSHISREDLYWHVSIYGNCDGGISPSRSESASLSWDIDIKLDKDGNVKKESSSWSGLSAVTPAQVADLKECVRVIEIINDMDWTEIVHADRPNYSDYDTVDHELTKRLDQQHSEAVDEIRSAELEDIIANPTRAIRLRNCDYYAYGKCYIIPTAQTEKFVKGYMFPENMISYGYSLDDIMRKSPEARTLKTNLIKSEEGWDTIDLPQ